MPKTAMLMKDISEVSDPVQMTDIQLEAAIKSLREDLQGDPIGFIAKVAPESDSCECGSIQLSVIDPRLDEETRHSLLRVLATPFGDIVRESFRRSHGYPNIRFGWDGMKDSAPQFMSRVEIYRVQSADASSIPGPALAAVIHGISIDMPDIMAVIEEARVMRRSIAIPPSPGPNGQREWEKLVSELMFVFATPLRKYVVEWFLREHGLRIGAVNCCMVPVGEEGEHNSESWKSHIFAEQVKQQVTPDC